MNLTCYLKKKIYDNFYQTVFKDDKRKRIMYTLVLHCLLTKGLLKQQLNTTKQYTKHLVKKFKETRLGKMHKQPAVSKQLLFAA